MRIPSLWRFISALILIATTSSAPARAQADPDARPDCMRIREVGRAVAGYVKKNDGKLPPDIAALVPLVAKDGERTADTIRNRMMAAGIPGPDVPNDAKADWVNTHSTYVYLGKPGVDLSEVPLQNEIVMVHLKLDQGHPSAATADGPADEWFTFSSADGGSGFTTRAHMAAAAEESAQVIEAIRTGAQLPDRFEMVYNLRAVQKAMAAYSGAHNGELPPDLGSLLPFVKGTKRLQTAAQRASVFLSPRIKKGLHVPDEPTADWINRNTPFVYLGHQGIKLASVEDGQRTILIHVKPEDVVQSQGHDQELFAVVNVWGGVDLSVRAYYDRIIPHSKQVIEAARSGTPLPPEVQAFRDLRHIVHAIEGYAKAHDGALPPDLGSTVEYLPKDVFVEATAQEKARVYLSPRLARVTQPPENADAAWITAHSDYRYLGDARITWKALRETSYLVLVHAPLEEEFTSMQDNMAEPFRVTPIGMSSGGAELSATQWFGEQLERSKTELARLRQGGK